MYDTGASISFARPGLVVGTVEELMPLQATKVTLGDASVTQTRGARGHTFDVYGKAHDWIYQEMQLPKGIDFIIGMDFMTHHDVLLLPRRKQVLFGADLASAIDGDMGTVDTSNSSAADNVGRAGLHVAIDLSAQRGASVGNAVETIESTQMLGEADELSESGLEMRSVTASDCCIPPKTESLHGSKDWEPILCIDARVGNRMLQGNIDTSEILDMENGDSVEFVDTGTFAELSVLQSECEGRASHMWTRYTRVRSSSASTASTAVKNRMKQESKWKLPAITDPDLCHSLICVLSAAEKPEDTAMGDMTGIPEATAASAVRNAVFSAAGTVSTEARVMSDSDIKNQARYDEFSRAASTVENPIAPLPENMEAWLDKAYPRDENGVSIREQIDITMPEHRQWVQDLMGGKVCELAAAAFNMNPTFDPPKWAEKMKLRVDENAGVPKAGARIRCPIHLREHMLEFHTKLYGQGYIEPATDCESYAPVLVIRKPDTADGKPRGFRFVVDLRNRNNTIHGMANYLPEACVIFEYLRGAKVISVFDVKDGYWACPLDESSIPLTAFQSECGAWVWKCLPQGLSCSGPYFNAWLTRIYRKYKIVIDQTQYMPVYEESKALSSLGKITSFSHELATLNSENESASAALSSCGVARYARRVPSTGTIEPKLDIRSANLAAIYNTGTDNPLETTSVHDVQDMDVSNLEYDASSRRVRATILISGDDLAILDGDRTDLLCSMSVTRPVDVSASSSSYAALETDRGDVVYASRAAHARMLEADPNTVNIDVWSTAVTGLSLDEYCAACTHANLDASGEPLPTDQLVGGIPMLSLIQKSRDDRKPSDLGHWSGKPFCSLYLDDAICASVQGGEQARAQCLTFLRISAVERIPLNEKAHLLCAYVRFLGMINGNGLVIPCPEKVKCIVALTRPVDLKGLQSFLGSVNWFRKWLISMAQLQAPLNALLVAGAEWIWTEECESAWLNLKRALMKFPVLRAFDPKLVTLLYTDSSKVHIGGVLCQRLADGSLVVNAYYSRSLRGPELTYPIQQQEMLAIVACCAAFEHYLLASHVTVRTCSDHRSLSQSFVGLSKQACDRITRWVQKVCVYNMTLEYIPGAQLDFADMLSRMMDQPEDAWKSMDVIDARDFEIAPLAAMCPNYFAYCALHAEQGSAGPDSVDVCESEDVCKDSDDFNVTWLPHECALLLPCPASDPMIKQSDMLCCNDFSQIYSALMVADRAGNGVVTNTRANKRKRADLAKFTLQRDEIISEAQRILDLRYEKLKLEPRDWSKTKYLPDRVATLVQQHSLIDGLLYFNSPSAGPILCIPDIFDGDGVNHRARMFEEVHATPYRGHRSVSSTQLAMATRVYWPKMNRDVMEMIKGCTCQADKINRRPQQGKLTSVQTPLSIFESYNADFMGPFPKSKNGNDCILLIVDRFSRRLFLYAVSKHMTSAQCAELFVDNICYREGRGLPLSIVSDNDKLFTANYWQTVFKRFGTKLHMATARTQSSNGLAERYVAVVEEILRTRVNYLQDDWEQLLSVIMFVCNNQDKVALMGRTPIEIETGATPIVPIDLASKLTLAKAVDKNRAGSTQPKAAAIARLERLEHDRLMVVNHLEAVKLDQKQYADKRRRDIVDLEVGGKAYVNMPAEQLAQHGLRPSAKLAHRLFGPFTIVKRVSANSFELELPTSAVNSRTISVFHVKFLEGCPKHHRYASPSALEVIPITGEGEDALWEISEIMDRRTRRGKHEFLCRYKGYPLLKDCQWRPEKELEELSRDMLAEFKVVYEERTAPGVSPLLSTMYCSMDIDSGELN